MFPASQQDITVPDSTFSLKSHIFWYVMLCHCRSSSHHFKRSWCLHCQSQADQEDIHCKYTGTTYWIEQHQIPEDLSLLICQLPGLWINHSINWSHFTLQPKPVFVLVLLLWCSCNLSTGNVLTWISLSGEEVFHLIQHLKWGIVTSLTKCILQSADWFNWILGVLDMTACSP